jgi:hypothetical protein
MSAGRSCPTNDLLNNGMQGEEDTTKCHFRLGAE